MLPVPYALYAAKAGRVENGSSSGSASTTVDFAVIPGDYGTMELSEIYMEQIQNYLGVKISLRAMLYI